MDSRNRARSWLLAGALAAGVAVGAASISAAASSGSGSTGTGTTATPTAPAPPTGQNPAKMSHGPGETLLTGDTAAKVKAAALAAVPGATIIRVETDSAGSPYEAHLTKADGSQVTVKVDSSFKVTATQAGFGAGPNGQGPGGPPPAGATTQ